MSEVEALLSTLRDIQEPVAPQGVSLGLLGANLVAAVLLVWALLAQRYRRRESWRIEARQRISQARQMDSDDGILHLARLLRQLLLRSHENINHLDGSAWLATLDEYFSTHWFSRHEGRIFGNALYQPHSLSHTDFQGLCDSLQQLVNTLPATPRAKPSIHDSV